MLLGAGLAYAVWLVPLGLLAFAVALRLRRWAASLSVTVVSAPPGGFSPGEAGIIVDGRFDIDDVVASVVQLAVRGIVSLERMANGDVLVSIRRDWQREPGLRASDVAMLARVYAHGDSVRPLSEFRGNVGELDDLFDTLATSLTERGLFSAPPSALLRVGRWSAIIVTAVWLQLAWSFGASLSSYEAAVATGLVLWGLASWFSRHSLSATGQRARKQMLGFREFLRRADKDALDRMPSDTFHKLLPWAIALRVTDTWIGRFAGRAVSPNDWYAASKPVGIAELGGEIKQLHALLRPHGAGGTVEGAGRRRKTSH
jgi:hypothetical protein